MHWRLTIPMVAALLALAGQAPSSVPARRSPMHKPQPALHVPTFQLDPPLLKSWPLLDLFRHPGVETLPASSRFMAGPWGMARWGEHGWGRLRLTPLAASMLPWTEALAPAQSPWLSEDASRDGAMSLVLWTPEGPAPAFADLSVFGTALVAPRSCERAAVTFSRHGAESDRFSLLSCDGAVAAEAVDRLSVMLRPIGVARPSLPLPEAAEDEAAQSGEWLPSIRLVHPRLVWLVQQVAEQFPRRALYVISGYRPGTHEGLHGKGRAIDLSVAGTPNEVLYQFCRTLRDVGCGYYPYHDFVHMDVRPAGSGKAYWIDDSLPGQRSNYVDSWPGVERSGAAVWDRWRREPDGAPQGD